MNKNLKVLADQTTSKMFGTLRFLCFCEWDSSDEDGWINFVIPEKQTRTSLFDKINEEDKNYFDKFEEMKVLENRGTGLQPSVRITPLGYELIAFICSSRYNGDPGWRKRSEVWYSKLKNKISTKKNAQVGNVEKVKIPISEKDDFLNKLTSVGLHHQDIPYKKEISNVCDYLNYCPDYSCGCKECIPKYLVEFVKDGLK